MTVFVFAAGVVSFINLRKEHAFFVLF
jgi:hypothetical protein